METHQSCSPRSTLLQTCYYTAPGNAFHHGASTLEHCPEVSARLYPAELSLQESCPKAIITSVLSLTRMRLPFSETLCWTIPTKIDVSDVWELMWVVIGAPRAGRGTLQQFWCSITHDGSTGFSPAWEEEWEGGFFPDAEEEGAAVFTFPAYTLAFYVGLLLCCSSASSPLSCKSCLGKGTDCKGRPWRGSGACCACIAAEARHSP